MKNTSKEKVSLKGSNAMDKKNLWIIILGLVLIGVVVC